MVDTGVLGRWLDGTNERERANKKEEKKMDYDYREAMADDIRDYIEENEESIREMNESERYDTLYDDMLMSDCITGNASGSYTFNTYRAEEYLCHNLDLLGEALREFGTNSGDFLEKGAETCDVIIRCYLLSEVLADVLREYDFDEGE